MKTPTALLVTFLVVGRFVLFSALVWTSVPNALAQGTVRFDNNIPGVLVTHAYMWSTPWYPYTVGNGPNDVPAGTQDYAGSIPLSGSGWSAQLWGAPGANRDYSSLQPSPSVTAFQTGGNAGFVAPVTAVFPNIPADATVATLQLRVWENLGGTITSYGAAVAAFPLVNVGVSAIFNVGALGGGANPPAVMTGLQSFSLAIPSVPEPGSGITLAVASAFYLFWRSRGRRM